MSTGKEHVPTDERFDRVRRALLLFSAVTVLIALGAERDVALVFSAQLATLPLWLTTVLLIAGVVYYGWAFRHYRDQVVVSANGDAGKLAIDDLIMRARRNMEESMQGASMVDYGQVMQRVDAAHSIRMAADEGEIAKLVKHALNDSEWTLDQVRRSEPVTPARLSVIERDLIVGITQHIISASAKFGGNSQEFAQMIREGLVELERQYRETENAFERISRSFHDIDRRLTKVSADYSSRARGYFQWWEVNVPLGLALLAIGLCVWNLGAISFEGRILSEVLRQPAQPAASPPPAAAPSHTGPVAGRAADTPPQAPPR